MVPFVYIVDILNVDDLALPPSAAVGRDLNCPVAALGHLSQLPQRVPVPFAVVVAWVTMLSDKQTNPSHFSIFICKGAEA